MPSWDTAGLGGQQPHLNSVLLMGRQGKGCPCGHRPWRVPGNNTVPPPRCQRAQPAPPAPLRAPTRLGCPVRKPTLRGLPCGCHPVCMFPAKHCVPSCRFCPCPRASWWSGAVCSWYGSLWPRWDPILREPAPAGAELGQGLLCSAGSFPGLARHWMNWGD